jgi:hypothetical protein
VACSYLIGKIIRWHDHDRQLRLVVVHLVAMGYKGWLTPQGWHGGIPPVSLVAVLAAMVPLIVKRKRVHDAQERAEARKEED